MSKPRCGVPDIIHEGHSTRRKRNANKKGNIIINIDQTTLLCVCVFLLFHIQCFSQPLEKKELDLSHFEIHDETKKFGRRSRNRQSFSNVGGSDGIQIHSQDDGEESRHKHTVIVNTIPQMKRIVIVLFLFTIIPQFCLQF